MIGRGLFAPEYKTWVLAAVVLVISGQMSPSHGAGHVLVWPVAEEKALQDAGPPLESYEIRRGRIAVSPEVVLQEPGTARRPETVIARGDAVTLTFFPDVTYQATVDAAAYHPDGTLSVSAGLSDHGIRTVTLTMGREGFLITLQDMNRAMLYRVAGDSSRASGTVTEIDMTKIPPVIR